MLVPLCLGSPVLWMASSEHGLGNLHSAQQAKHQRERSLGQSQDLRPKTQEGRKTLSGFIDDSAVCPNGQSVSSL